MVLPIYTSNPYCARADVKTALSLVGTQDDAYIDQLITEAQDTIEGEIGRIYQKTTTDTTQTYDGNNRNRVFIGECVSVTQVLEINQLGFWTPNGMYVPSTPQTRDITSDCLLYPYNGPIQYSLARLSGLGFEKGIQNYRVIGVFGFSSVPKDIERACIRLALHWFKMRDTNYADSVDPQGATIQHFGKGIPTDVMQILDNNRLRSFRR